ncbi:MAG: HNH endonuclease [Cellulomonas sp.]|nr:HNH endonuclease [Cellulomonas sp.]
MRPEDIVWVYQAGEQRIVARARAVQIYQQDDVWHVDLVWDLGATRALRRSPIPRSNFGQTPQNPVRANAGTLEVLRRWERATKVGGQSSPDPSGFEDARIRVLAEVVRRQGQQDFRRRLLVAYGRRCAISGCDVEGVLEAAHISPYLGPHTSGTENGLLLRADLHTLFDLHLIAIDQTRAVILSSALAGSDYEQFAGRKIRTTQSRSDHPSRDLLAKHRESLTP